MNYVQILELVQSEKPYPISIQFIGNALGVGRVFERDIQEMGLIRDVHYRNGKMSLQGLKIWLMQSDRVLDRKMLALIRSAEYKVHIDNLEDAMMHYEWE